MDEAGFFTLWWAWNVIKNLPNFSVYDGEF